jgi:pantetheine-phosphate adenylyltransferase
MMSLALVPGTFDPITLGHVDVIERSAQIFDNIIVGVAFSPTKRGGPLFNVEERVAFVEDAVSHLPNVDVEPFSKLLVDFAVDIKAQAIVKGLRAVTDFESEFQQASLNYHLNQDLETLFIMASPQHMYLSSSMVKEIAKLNGNVADWVTPAVLKSLTQKLGK